ncbi:MAG: T9SS type A sorting domain-containing protein [Bacteroidota bacterium]
MKKYILLLAAIFTISFANAQWQKVSGNSGDCFATIGNTIYAGTVEGVMMTSTDNGYSWITKDSIANSIDAIVIKDSNIFYGSWGDGVFLSTDNGNTWNAVNTGLSNLNVSQLAISGNNIFAATFGGGVFLSTNYGSSWTAVNTSLISNEIMSLAIKGDTIFAGTYGNGLYISTINGNNWSLSLNFEVNSLAINGNNIFVGTDNGVFLSTNNGAYWTPVNNGLTDTNVFSLAIKGDTIFAATENGVYLSTDNGNSWNFIGLAGFSVNSIAICGNTLLAGTWVISGGVFDGIWKRSLLEQDTITTTSSPNIGGSALGNGIFTFTQTCTVKALSNIGYGFVNWTENGNIVSTDSIFTFTITASRNLVANFLQLYTITTTTNPAIEGTSYGGGLYVSGQICSVNAIPFNGNAFIDWTENGNIVSTDTNYTFTVTGNRNLIANFTQTLPQYTITTYAIPTTGGSIIGGGTYIFNQSCSLLAIPNADYAFTYWTENGNIICIDTSYTFNVTADRYLFANFTSTQGIISNTLNESISIYPNPTTNNLIIETNTNKEQRIEIINLIGQTIYTTIINKKVVINTSAFAKGVYILKLYTDKETVVRKFVKE